MQGQNSRKCKQIQTSRANNRQKSQLEKTYKQYDKEIKGYTPLPVCKQLAESLILLKLGYCNKLLLDIPKYMKQHLQKVQNPAAGFVLNKYAKINDVINIKWLPVE